MSEIITSANVTSFVRSLIGEETTQYWTDNEITLYIKFGMQAVMNKYWYLIAPRDAKVVQASLVASTSYIGMPGASVGAAAFTGSGLDDATYGGVYGHRADLDYEVQIDGTGTPDTFKWSKDDGSTYEATTVAITGSAQDLDNGVTVTFAATTGHTSADLWDSDCVSTNVSKILRVEVAEDRTLLRHIEANDVWRFSEFDDGSASSNYLNVWYLENKSTIGDFSEALRPLIAFEAVAFARAKDGGLDGALLAMQRGFESSAITFLSTESMYEPAIFSDFTQDRQYTNDNPVGWCYRDGRIFLYKAYDED
jgi:hypothetical protein